MFKTLPNGEAALVPRDEGPQPGVTRRGTPLWREICGLTLVLAMGLALQWDFRLRTAEMLVPAQAQVLTARCEASGRSGPSRYWTPVVRFEYLHEGSRQVGYAPLRERQNHAGAEADCRRTVQELEQQPNITAWVDPGRPKAAVLNKQSYGTAFPLTVAGLGVFLFVVGAWSNLRRLRNPRR